MQTIGYHGPDEGEEESTSTPPYRLQNHIILSHTIQVLNGRVTKKIVTLLEVMGIVCVVCDAEW